MEERQRRRRKLYEGYEKKNEKKSSTDYITLV